MALRIEDIDLAADRELVERWQAGEQAAFDDLYRRYFDRLRAHCYRRVGDRHVAEELAQEAFVKALQALPKLAGERRFYPWVSVIATRLCVDHHRRLGRVRPSEDIDAGSVDGDHGARLAFLADVDNLDRAMNRLGPRHAEVLELRERRGMTYAEIADHLEVPQSTVEALLFRARKALRREFLAVAGEGRLASLPLVGALLRRLMSARDRIGEALPTLSQLGSPVAAGAMAVVMAGGSFAAPPASAHDAPRAVAPALTAVSTSSPAAVALPTPAAATQHVHGAPTERAEPPARTIGGVEPVSADEAREDGSDMPVFVDTGDVGAALDPIEMIGWLSETDQEDR